MIKKILILLLSVALAGGALGTVFYFELKGDFYNLIQERLAEINYDTLQMNVDEYIVFDEIKAHYDNKPLNEYLSSNCKIDKTIFMYLNKQDRSTNLYAECINDIDKQLEEIIMRECDYMLLMKDRYKNNVVDLDKDGGIN